MIWKLYCDKRGGHVWCRLFVGPQRHSLGKAGSLILKWEEFRTFAAAMRGIGADLVREETPQGKPEGDDDIDEILQHERVANETSTPS